MLTREDAATAIADKTRSLYTDGVRDNIHDQVIAFAKESGATKILKYFSVLSVINNTIAELNPPDPVDVLALLGFSVESVTKVGEQFVIMTEHGKVTVDAKQLLSNSFFREAMLAQTNKVANEMKKPYWNDVVEKLIAMSTVDLAAEAENDKAALVMDFVRDLYRNASERELAYMNAHIPVIHDGKFCFRIIDLTRDVRSEFRRDELPRNQLASILTAAGFTNVDRPFNYWWIEVAKAESL